MTLYFQYPLLNTTLSVCFPMQSVQNQNQIYQIIFFHAKFSSWTIGHEKECCPWIRKPFLVSSQLSLETYRVECKLCQVFQHSFYPSDIGKMCFRTFFFNLLWKAERHLQPPINHQCHLHACRERRVLSGLSLKVRRRNNKAMGFRK